MTKVILANNADYIRLISKLPDDMHIYSSTFNISSWEESGPAKSILREMNLRNSHLVVGIPFFRSCTGDYGRGRCRSCYQKHQKILTSLATLRDSYPKIDWRFVTNLHAKFLVAGSLIVTGGRNITDGDLADLSFAEKDADLAEQLRVIWHEYAAKAYDIGTSGPLVFTTPYKGELLADSSSISQEYRAEVIRAIPSCLEAQYWASEKPSQS